MKRKQITTTLDEELLKEFRKIAIDEDRNLNEILEELMEKYIKEKKGN